MFWEKSLAISKVILLHYDSLNKQKYIRSWAKDKKTNDKYFKIKHF